MKKLILLIGMFTIIVGSAYTQNLGNSKNKILIELGQPNLIKNGAYHYYNSDQSITSLFFGADTLQSVATSKMMPKSEFKIRAGNYVSKYGAPQDGKLGGQSVVLIWEMSDNISFILAYNGRMGIVTKMFTYTNIKTKLPKL
ncbi:MAG TPA: hypothetical protein VK982_12140 [Bacteroidales bacterium]|nr:hypothetical protein [Bacteroidales bacterium]